MGIRIILIASLALAGWLVLRQSTSARTQAVRRLSTIGLVSAGIFFVLSPTSLSDIAHLLGVGRGTDLLLYAFVVVAIFTAVALVQRIHRLERRLEKLTRAVALAEHRESELDHR